MGVTSNTIDRNDPNRYQDLANILVNDSDAQTTGVAFDFGKINEIESYMYDVRQAVLSGSINVNQFDLNSITDSVTSTPAKTSSASNYTPASVHGTAIAANSSRKEFYIQNLGAPAVYVKLGSSPTLTSFNVLLSGNNLVYRDESYTGIVTTTGNTNSPSFIAWERV